MSRGEEVVDAPWKSRNSETDRPRDYRGARVLMRSGEGEEEGREREREGVVTLRAIDRWQIMTESSRHGDETCETR